MRPLLVFDYDGVIHNNLCVYEPAFRRVHEEMIQGGIIPPETVSTERLSGWFGMTAKDMWIDFHPELPESVRDEAAYNIGMNLISLVAEHKARWYDGAKEMLDALKSSGYEMVILSNSRKVTGEIHWKEFGLGKWFLKWYDSESSGWKPKTEIIKDVLADHPGKCIVIGDRYADLEAAKAAGAPFVGCTYGFAREGELDEADLKAASPMDIPEMIGKLK